MTSVLTLKTAKPHRGPQTIEVVLSGGLTGKYHLRLYVAGATARSRLALRRIYQLYEENKGNYKLEVIDVYQQPEQARENQIVATPTLVKFLPLPMRRFIGNLCEPRWAFQQSPISSSRRTSLEIPEGPRSYRLAPSRPRLPTGTRLAEAEEALRAIRSEEVVAVVVSGKRGPQVLHAGRCRATLTVPSSNP